MQFLDRLVGELDHTRELSPQQLGVALREKSSLVFVQCLLGRFWSHDEDVHDGLQRGAFHVCVHELFGLLVRPTMIVRDDLELRAPGQKVFPRKVREVLNLSVVWTRGPLEWPVGTLLASLIQGKVLEPFLSL